MAKYKKGYKVSKNNVYRYLNNQITIYVIKLIYLVINKPYKNYDCEPVLELRYKNSIDSDTI